jgi:hypothetical protein
MRISFECQSEPQAGVIMPIIIWGSRGLTSTVDRGEFHCPKCDRREEYTLKQTRPWFTLYFIPIFPVGGGQRYVECAGCGQAYKESVLEYEAPSEGDRLAAEVYEDLRDGASLDSAKRKLTKQGSMAEAEAEELVMKMCDGKPQVCSCGQRLHPEVRECRYCGGKL